MLKAIKYYFLFLILSVPADMLYAQQMPRTGIPDSVDIQAGNTVIPEAPVSIFTVRYIVVTGNKKTKTPIILREIPFRPGDQYSLQQMVEKFERARRQLINTGLFHEAIISLKGFEENNIDVSVKVFERWYIFPLPYFKPVDRNLNQWLFEHNANLDRVNYGAKLLYNNFTGHNDKLRLGLVTGYTRQISFNYDRLYIDRKMKWGMKFSLTAGKNREINYNTIGNKQAFLKDSNLYLRNFFNTAFELTYRKAIKTRHRFGIAYANENIKDTVVALNPVYYPGGRHRISFPELYYSMQYFDLDYNPYPTKGYAAEISIAKKGFNQIINLWQLQAKLSGSWPLSQKTFFNTKIYAGIKFPFHQPYALQRLLGYSDVFMQGYEYYVIDGAAGAYIKAALTKQILNFNMDVPATKFSRNERLPVRILAKIFGNAGYVYHPQPGNNSLTNRMLYSGGIGIDIVTWYDFVFKVEWTFNQLGQNGLFLHRRSTF